MIWFKYAVHDYMDLKPRIAFRLFENAESAEKWAMQMTAAYSGGPTYIIGPATKSEIFQYIEGIEDALDELTLQDIQNDNNYQK